MINIEKNGVSEVELKKAIEASEDIIMVGDNKNEFMKYSQGFFANTECIKEYLEKEDFAKTRALSVLASGDHIFNLVHAGVGTIDAFDINLLQYFVYQLRVAFVKKFDYESFWRLNVSFASGYFVKQFIDIIKELKEYLPDDVYEYYRRILDFSLKPRGFKGLYNPVVETLMFGNNYLKSEEDYLLLRKKLDEVEVNIYIGDVFDVPQELKEKYSIILLSNIADYLSFKLKKFGLKEFNAYINSFKEMLFDNGLIVNYLYAFYDEFDRVIRSTVKAEAITPLALGVDNVCRIESYPYNMTLQGYYRVRKK